MLCQQNGSFLLQSAHLLLQLRLLRRLHAGQHAFGELAAKLSVHSIDLCRAR